MDKGLIFDIKRFAIHDGPGIRTTIFFKGCPLRCEWCHNPEGHESKLEIMIRPSRCLKECIECLSVCPQSAISKEGKHIRINQTKCDFCGRCKDVCVYEAIDIVGREVTVKEAVEEIEKDKIFFDESGGGVTLSGGEPLMKPDFSEALLWELKKRGIHTAVDTSGYASFKDLERVSKNTDLFLYDIKIMDEKKHYKYTGKSNKIIHENLKKLSENGKPITIRIPLIEGINDDEENIRETAEFLISLKSIKNVNLLTYHQGGYEKRRRLQKRTPQLTFKSPPSEKVKAIKKTLLDCGFSVKIGG